MNLVELSSTTPDLIVDIRYAKPSNITGRALYDAALAVPHLDATAANALMTVVQDLKQRRLRLVVWDAFRPAQVQKELRAVLDDDHYVSPDSNHCKGLAIDVTLADMDGNYLDMGTDFDEFSEKAHIDTVDISAAQSENRLVLRGAMQKAGFSQWAYEWWHFDYLSQ